MAAALYLNGVFESVLDEIVSAQQDSPRRVCYLQPYSPNRIKLLADTVPTSDSPIRLYVSATNSLSVVSFRAKIVGWHDKRLLDKPELESLDEHIRKFQPSEKRISLAADDGQPIVNLIAVAQLERLAAPISVSLFTKLRDNEPLKGRTRAGGWAYVHALPEWVETAPIHLAEQVAESYADELVESLATSAEARAKRLAKAPKLPQVMQILAKAFRRNQDVVAAVLMRADGVCEHCGSDAPFTRRSDGSPYLEIHHRKMLAEGGEDTIENAIAVCPNCHRYLHFGIQ